MITLTPAPSNIIISRYADNPYEGWGAYAASDANAFIQTPDGHTLGFHITSLPGREGILLDKAKVTSCRVGFTGSKKPKAFWLNNAPFIPYSIEQTMPIDGGDIAILGFIVPSQMPVRVIESTWPWTQWPMREEDLDGVKVFDVTPEDFPRYRSAEALRNLRKYIPEGLSEGSIRPDWYAAKLHRLLREMAA